MLEATSSNRVDDKLEESEGGSRVPSGPRTDEEDYLEEIDIAEYSEVG